MTRQQGQFSMLVTKDITDTVSGVLRTSDMALWNGSDTDLMIPTSFSGFTGEWHEVRKREKGRL